MRRTGSEWLTAFTRAANSFSATARRLSRPAEPSAPSDVNRSFAVDGRSEYTTARSSIASQERRPAGFLWFFRSWTAFVRPLLLSCPPKERQHKALSTEKCYVFWLRRYINSLREMPADLSSERKLEHFLTDLACGQNVSASTQNQAFNAILFFYRDVLWQPLENVEALRATRPAHERHAPSVVDTQQLLQTIRNEGD
jgi:Phage integrase, N-terminal SAM-like domain